MRKEFLFILVSTTVFFASAVQAQPDATERDPFYPFPDRPGVTAPHPGGDDDGQWGRDPFDNPFAGKALVQKGPSTPGVRMLTGIIYSNNLRLAIFGGETYHEGGMVGDRKLVEIRRRSVVFMSAAGSREEVFLEDFSMSK